MANSPIQVVLNTNDFIEALEHKGSGPSTDFFADRDEEFIGHKETLNQQLHEIKKMQFTNKYAPVSYAKITMRQSALAKSHRPSSMMFKTSTAPIVGAGDLGELYVEFTPNSIDTVSSQIEKAETTTRWKEKDGNRFANPSRLRSEIGAIDKITPHTSSDKRKFSVQQAIEWLSNPQSGGAYIVELFDNPPPKKDWDTLDTYKRKLFKSFIDGLEGLGSGLLALKIKQGKGSAILFGIKLEEGNMAPVIQLQPIRSSASKSTNNKNANLDIKLHAQLLDFLDAHPLVKKVILPPIITQSSTAPIINRIRETIGIPVLNSAQKYPKMCIVDGGVSNIYGEWVEDRWELINPNDKDENHGSFIAGLVIMGQELNGHATCTETNGCRIIDLDILPNANYSSYFSKPLEFFNELEIAVQELKARTGVRIFNFSLNIDEHVTSNGYSISAQFLDKIAEENDVVFVISAGNTHPRDMRKEWPIDPVEALNILATSRNDIVKVPAESCRNISVSALNPPNLDGVVPYGLSNYSCRGPGPRIGLKPDLAHIGGAGTRHPSLGHGLFSLNAKGEVVDDCGTSYAAPNVARIMASLENSIEGDVSRETLMALCIHHAALPEVFHHKHFASIAKHLVGFGLPQGSNNILNGSDNAITLVFANRVTNGRKLSFSFSWPSCLVKNGKCIGQARLTIVSTPLLDYRYGSEFVRVNIDARLRQMKNDGKYSGRLQAIYTPDSGDGGLREKDLIEHSLKWSPIKVYEKTFKKGVGPTTDWKLEVEYLTRDGVQLPAEGLPFTAILTISDPKTEEPVFNDMRQTLQAIGVQTVDIKTAARIVARI